MFLAALFFEFWTANADAKTLRVLPLGDSITYGLGSSSCGSDNSSCGGYRTFLYSQLRARGLSFQFVGGQRTGPASFRNSENEGHPNWRIDEIADHVDEYLDHARPDIILLHIGTNDISQGGSTDDAAASVSKSLERLRILLGKIRAKSPGAQIFVAGIIPIRGVDSYLGGTESWLDDRIRKYNQGASEIVKNLAAGTNKVVYVDMYSSLDPSSRSADINADQLHPTDLGYEKMASRWSAAILAGQQFFDTGAPNTPVNDSR